MARVQTQSLIFILNVGMLALLACNPTVKSGRNSDPSKWPEENPDEATDVSDDGQPVVNPDRPAASCFQTSSDSLPVVLESLCEDDLASHPAFAEMRKIICERRFLINSFDRADCGWPGAPVSKSPYIHMYYVQRDRSLDYEDVHVSTAYVKVDVEKMVGANRLAFEDFASFKRRGLQWVAGTREQSNLSGTSWDQGLSYRFRVEKELYEIGYDGFTKLHKLGPGFYVHVNHATGNFARMGLMGQVVFYKGLADGGTISVKLEHRKMDSRGLYDFARKNGIELIYEMMDKGGANALKL